MTVIDDDRVRREGRAAHHRGEALEANPHPPDHPACGLWAEGWRSGEAEWAPAWQTSWPDDIGL